MYKMSTVNVIEMNTSMRIGTYPVTAETTVGQLKAIMLGRDGMGNEDMLAIIFGGRIVGDSDLVLSLAGDGGALVVRFGAAPSEGGRRRRRTTRRRKSTRRH
jgi:hypothetical protein